jgi:hypothetical protein
MSVVMGLVRPQLGCRIALLFALLVATSITGVDANQIPLNGQALIHPDWPEIERALVEHGVQPVDILPQFHLSSQNHGCEVVVCRSPISRLTHPLL